MKTITVWGYKVMSVTDGLYNELQQADNMARCEIINDLVDMDDVTDVSDIEEVQE